MSLNQTNVTNVIMHPLAFGNLKTHLKTNSGEKPNKCSQCDYASSRGGDLRRHLKKHIGEKSNICNQCEYASSEGGNLRRHLKIHTEKAKDTTSVSIHPLG